MPDIFAFYTPEHGANVNLIIAWIIALGFSRRLFLKLGDKLSDLILKLLNKIPFFADTDLDEQLVAVANERIKLAVTASMQDAQAIKDEYMVKIAAAGKDSEKVLALSQEMRAKLEGLTKNIVADFSDGSEKALWDILVKRYGNHATAAKWVYQKVRALVEQLKTDKSVSTSGLILNHLLEGAKELGNELSKERG